METNLNLSFNSNSILFMSKFQVKFKFILIHILLNRKEEEKCKKLMQKKNLLKIFFLTISYIIIMIISDK
jgi:hypothetical protein